MKEETLSFQTIPVNHQNRFQDRISFLYLERAKVVQSDSGVVAWSTEKISEDDEGIDVIKSELQLPVASLALLSLGPGTSITNAALTSCARSGCVVQFTSSGAFPEHASIIPLTSSSKWAVAQATVISDLTKAKKVAKAFYGKQFGIDDFEGSISQMRGIEGSLVKKLYQGEARKWGVKNWRRNTLAEDQINVSLNIANGILYGVSACLVNALAMNPALGVIHRGHAKSFLFDIADLYKPFIAIPIAFSMAGKTLEDVPRFTRSALRREIVQRKLMRDISTFLMDVFTPYLPASDEDRLIGNSQEVLGHRNYGVVKELDEVF